jgi:nitrogen regulatory protein PII
VLRIKSTDDARTGTGLDMLIVPEAMPRYNWVARHEYDIRKLYLMVKPFKTWCIKQQLNHSGMVELIVNELHGKKEKIRIGKGTTISLPSMNVISLTWDDEEHNDIVQAQIDVLAMEDDEIKAV